MHEISGRSTLDSSRQSDRQFCLGNKSPVLWSSDTNPRDLSNQLSEVLGSRLMKRLASTGTPEYVLTWNRHTTPSRHVIFQLHARARSAKSGFCVAVRLNGNRESSEHLTSASDSSGARFSGWPTPNLPSGGPNVNSTPTHTGGMDLDGATTLVIQSPMAGWPTPMAGSPATETNNEAGNTDSSRRMVELVGWPTPNVPNGGRTLTQEETVSRSSDSGRKIQVDLQAAARLTDPGATSNSSPALTAKRGVLNPALPRWLQGLPRGWCVAGILAHRAIQQAKADLRAQKRQLESPSTLKRRVKDESSG